MNHTIPKSLIKTLRNLYDTDETAAALFDHYSARSKDVRQTTVRRAVDVTENLAHSVREVFRQLEEAGAGKFKLGRRGQETRFEWSYGVRSLSAAAKGEADEPKAIDETQVEEIDDIPAQPTSTTDGIDHEFVLRPGRKVVLRLPSDLTDREAERLAKFVVSLPFEGAW